MIFKRCTIGGVDFGHNSLTDKSVSSSTVRRAIIPVNPTLNELLAAADIPRLLLEKRDNNKAKMQTNVSGIWMTLISVWQISFIK
jgi:hypothetical protein